MVEKNILLHKLNTPFKHPLDYVKNALPQTKQDYIYETFATYFYHQMRCLEKDSVQETECDISQDHIF